MSNQSLVQRQRSETRENLIEFPMNHRVRCPRCGSPRIATGDADAPARYGCLSADDFQSEACILRAKERGSKNLMSETQSILTKYGFAPEPGLRVVG